MGLSCLYFPIQNAGSFDDMKTTCAGLANITAAPYSPTDAVQNTIMRGVMILRNVIEFNALISSFVAYL